MRRLGLLSIVLIMFLGFSSMAQSIGSETDSKEIKRFFQAYQLMVKYANDTMKIKSILDTVQVPDYVKEVLEFMAFYYRAVLGGEHEPCVKRARQLLDKIEKEYRGQIPERHYKWMIGAVNQGYGSCLYYLGDYINSFLTYKEAYEMFNSVGDSTLAAITLTNMATVLMRVKMYDEVLKYYVMAKKYLIKDSLRLVPLNLNIGAMYMYLERPDLALRYYNEALMLAHRVMEK
ncbi:MAG: tetratricopeptide repeat protein, partial [Chlorobi bacterium]|nr:tetratricopeptide repeat protein [Chlorobiota bacterium]